MTLHSKPVSTRAMAGYDYDLEGLRGVAALLVAAEHLWIMNILYPMDRIPLYVKAWSGGQAAVLVFFVLSGYVIGLTNAAPFSTGRARAYLSRRALRLLPIYWIALGLTLCVGRGDPPQIYIATALLLQNQNVYGPWHLHPPLANGPMWTLHYEAVYYLSFLLLWRRPRWLLPSFVLALVVSVVGWVLPAADFPRFIAGYASGWIFWSAGWWLSRQPRAEGAAPQVPLLAGLFLLIATHHLNSGNIFLHGLGLKQTNLSMVNLSNLALLPSALMLVGGVTRRNFPFLRTATWLAFLIPIGTTLLLLATGRIGQMPSWIAGGTFTAMALLVAAWRRQGWLRHLAPMGHISYAFYLVHMPMLWVVASLGFVARTPLEFIGAASIWLALSIALAAILEIYLQPRLRRWWQYRSAIA